MKQPEVLVGPHPASQQKVARAAFAASSMGNPDHRQRDLFPLPFLEMEQGPSVGMGVGARRSRAKRVARAHNVNEVIDCLNEVFAPDVSVPAKPMNLSHELSQKAILKQIAHIEDTSCKHADKNLREAARQLLHTSHSYDCEEVASVTTVRPYQRDNVAIPQVGSQPPRVMEVLDNVGREVLEDFSHSMLLDHQEWGKVCEKQSHVKTYMDERLKSDPQLYQQFIRDLYKRNMLSFTSSAEHIVTPFFVVKKNGTLRLVWDCRGVNQRFRNPPPLATAAGYSWGQLEVDENDTLYVAQSDIKDFFYALELPRELQKLFCLPAVPTSILAGWNELDGKFGDLLRDHEYLYPTLTVVPM